MYIKIKLERKKEVNKWYSKEERARERERRGKRGHLKKHGVKSSSE